MLLPNTDNNVASVATNGRMNHRACLIGFDANGKRKKEYIFWGERKEMEKSKRLKSFVSLFCICFVSFFHPMRFFPSHCCFSHFFSLFFYRARTISLLSLKPSLSFHRSNHRYVCPLICPPICLSFRPSAPCMLLCS